MSLPWVRLDTSLPSHDKVVDLIEEHGDRGRAAMAVYVFGLAYCGQHETDGLITYAALKFVHGTKRHAEILVTVGLWRPHPKGWEVANYLNRQASARVAELVRADRKRAGAKGNCVRHHGPDCGCWRDRIAF